MHHTGSKLQCTHSTVLPPLPRHSAHTAQAAALWTGVSGSRALHSGRGRKGPSLPTGLQFSHHLMHTGPHWCKHSTQSRVSGRARSVKSGQWEGEARRCPLSTALGQSSLLTVSAKRSCSLPFAQLPVSKGKRQLPFQSLGSGRAGVKAPAGGASRSVVLTLANTLTL